MHGTEIAVTMDDRRRRRGVLTWCRTAVRHAFYAGWRVARPSVVEACRRARAALSSSSNDVASVGACTLDEGARRQGDAFYSDFVRRYALRGLLRRAERELDETGTVDAGATWAGRTWRTRCETTWQTRRYTLTHTTCALIVTLLKK